MLLKRTLVIFACILIAPPLGHFSTILHAEIAAKQEPTDFNGQLHLAYQIGLLGDLKESTSRFEKLLKSNPTEFIVYDFYAQILERHGNYSKAIEIYEKGLPHDKISDRPGDPSDIRTKIGVLHQKMEFAKKMKDIGPWRKLRPFIFEGYWVTTNVPGRTAEEILAKFDYYFNGTKAVLATIFEKPAIPRSRLHIVLITRQQDYVEYKNNLRRKKINLYPSPFQWKSTYLPQLKELVIFYDGEHDETALVNQLTQYFLVESYISNPSAFLTVGIGDYVAYKLAKRPARRYLLDNLELMNWFYDQGGWEDALDIFPAWEAYASYQHLRRIPSEWIVPYIDSMNLFHLRSWSLIYFFLDGTDEYFTSFLKKYLAYEIQNRRNDSKTARDFFKKNIPKNKLEELNNKWGKFSIGITYEKI